MEVTGLKQGGKKGFSFLPRAPRPVTSIFYDGSMKITSAAPFTPTTPSPRKHEAAGEAPTGDVYERRADQRQALSRKEIMEYLRSRGMEI